MLTIKKSSFLFRLWLAIMRAMPMPFCSEKFINQLLEHANLCRFIRQIIGYGLIMFLIYFMCGIGVLLYGPLLWCFGLIVLAVAFLLGYRPTIAELSKQESIRLDEVQTFQRWFEYTLIWCTMPLECSTRKNRRRYRTLSVFGRPIYPYHLIIPAFLYWLVNAIIRRSQTDSTFAEGIANVVWGIGLFVTAAATVLIIISFSKSDTGRVVRAYLHAKKQRVCPRLTFTDD